MANEAPNSDPRRVCDAHSSCKKRIPPDIIGRIDPYAVTSAEELREIYREPTERSILKEQRRLDHHCRDFIARSPFMLIASSSARGECDVSPKGGPAGFVRVLDDLRVAIPDATGNNRLDSMQNIIENPRSPR